MEPSQRWHKVFYYNDGNVVLQVRNFVILSFEAVDQPIPNSLQTR